MKTLLFLNGPEGWQTGIEDGFLYLNKTGKISELKWFYFEDYAKHNSQELSKNKMIELAKEFQPKLIIFFHISKFPINKNFILQIRDIDSKPIIAYDEGDMYGGWSKPISDSMKVIIKHSDYISIRGLGEWAKQVRKINKNIIYTPHSNSLYRFSKQLILPKDREKNFIFIGSRVRSKLGNIRRLHGAKGREKLVRDLGEYFPEEVRIYGKGWNGFIGNMGVLKFQKQIDICKDNWFHISYEHYPEIPYYLSDRLPIALSTGQIYICHYHKGYENIFKNTDFIYFFNSNKEAIDIMNYLKTLSDEQLYIKSIHAKEWLEKNLNPEIVWGNLFDRITAKLN